MTVNLRALEGKHRTGKEKERETDIQRNCQVTAIKVIKITGILIVDTILTNTDIGRATERINTALARMNAGARLR